MQKEQRLLRTYNRNEKLKRRASSPNEGKDGDGDYYMPGASSQIKRKASIVMRNENESGMIFVVPSKQKRSLNSQFHPKAQHFLLE
jgi:hypothetical protein